MTSNKKIIVIGSCNTDMVIKAEHLPKPGETIIGSDFLMNHGGKGANQAVAAARLGGDTSFICKMGNDMFGHDNMDMLKKEGIDMTCSSFTNEKPSGVALINVDQNGENCIVVASGANSLLSEDDIEKARPAIKEASIVLMQLETPIKTLIYAAKVAKECGAMVVLNPAPAPKEKLPIELLENVDILIPNETEAQMISEIDITDENSLKNAILKITALGVKTVIVTIGAAGSIFYKDGKLVKIPAFPVKAVDTTAAGDTFCGAFCVSLCSGLDLKDAILFANKASSISVTRMGAQISIPHKVEVCI
jgi:ribokinase